MHACLHVPEIISSIFTFLEDEHPDGGDWPELDIRSIAYVARTCKIFYDPAIGVLWEYQTSLGPLTRVMPRDLWSRPPYYGDVSFSRPLLETDWESFNLYGSRIRHLRLHRGSLGITTDVLIALAAYRPVRCLLPQLRSLKFYDDLPDRALETLPAFLGESIQAIRIEGSYQTHSNNRFLIPLLASLARCCPQVSDVQLSPDVWRASATLPLAFSVPHILTRFQHLRTLSVHLNWLTPEMMCILGSIEPLQSLSMEAGEKRAHASDSPLTSGLTFKEAIGLLGQLPIFSEDTRLKALKVRDIDAEDLQAMLNIAPSNLQALSASLASQPAHFKAVIALPRFLQLTSLDLNYARCSYQDIEDEENPPTLNNLLALRFLRKVVLAGVPNVLLLNARTSAWTEEISTALPNLESLYLSPQSEEEGSLPLEVLIPLSKNARNLVHLSISGLICQPFDIAAMPSWTPVSNLEEFEFTFTTMKDPLFVTHCISTLFPKVVFVEGWYTGFNRREGPASAREELYEAERVFEEAFPYQTGLKIHCF